MGRERSLRIWAVLVLAPMVLTLNAAACQGRLRERIKERRAEAKGLQMESMEYLGRKRVYYVELPPDFDPSKESPLIVALHGGGGKASTFDETMTGGKLGPLADEQGYVRLYPEAWDERWNDGRDLDSWESHKLNIDDVGYISKLIDLMISEYGVDPKRVFVTGLSNGGLMSYRLAQEIPQKITAVAAFVADLPEKRASITPKGQLPILMMNGTKDPLMPFEGGDSYSEIGFKKIYLGKFLSARATAEYWAKNNGCEGSKTTELEDASPSDGTRVRKTVFGCKPGKEVVFYEIEGGGHTWPGGKQYMAERSVGAVSKDIDATRIILQFFKDHSPD